MSSGTCRSYKAPIVWIKTGSGKPMPCDATPTYYIAKPRSGTKRIVTPNGEVIACEYTEDPYKASGTGFIPHWSTCPNADTFRRQKKGGNHASDDLHG